MLIVCPNCATSYMIDPASVGSTGRSVRCARCKTTWFAGGPKSDPQVSAFVNDVIAEAEAQTGGTSFPSKLPPARGFDMPPQARMSDAAAPDDFGAEPEQPAVAGEPGDVWPSTQPAMPGRGLAPHRDDFPQTIVDAPSLVPPIEHEQISQTAESTAESGGDDTDSFVARRQRLKMRREKSRRSSHWTAVILVLFAFNVALIGARNEVVRYLPQTASLFSAVGLPVNLRNLKFENVRISKQSQDGADILVVEGQIVSTSSRAVEVPRLRFAARNTAGQEVYTWTMLPDRSILGPDESLDFRSTLASPPADATDVMVRFFNAQDAVKK